jgi:hypothetical protein
MQPTFKFWSPTDCYRLVILVPEGSCGWTGYMACEGEVKCVEAFLEKPEGKRPFERWHGFGGEL